MNYQNFILFKFFYSINHRLFELTQHIRVWRLSYHNETVLEFRC